MAYKPFQLKDIYQYILENDQAGIEASKWLNLSPSQLSHQLSQLKKTNPTAYGSVLVKLFANSQTRQNLLDVIT